MAQTDDESANKACENCGSECQRDSVHNGECMLYGPWGCPQCGWSESEEYNQLSGRKFYDGIFVDQYGVGHPTIRE